MASTSYANCRNFNKRPLTPGYTLIEQVYKLLLNLLPGLKKLQLSSRYNGMISRVLHQGCEGEAVLAHAKLSDNLSNAGAPLQHKPFLFHLINLCGVNNTLLPCSGLPLSPSASHPHVLPLCCWLLGWEENGAWGREGCWKAILLTNGLQSYQLRLSEA